MRTLSTALVLGAFIAASFLLVGPKEQAYAGEVDVSADMLDDLEDGLRSSDAIGIAAKLSLKARIDSLVDEFRHFHQGQSELAIQALETRFETLLQDTLGLVRSGDPSLFIQISSAREELWVTLSDPDLFEAAVGSAGSTLLAMRNGK